ncbi:hypothetical protein [Nocardiopsis sp. NPDC057823]|uniref:hypothetical protein n=1 Tax=Nocardiopsis sp. NPDC057823 TaxID=3346256 RepID=UPI00366C5D50
MSVLAQQFDHGRLGEVASITDLPFIVHLGQHRLADPPNVAGSAKARATSALCLTSRFNCYNRLVGQIFFLCLVGKSANAATSTLEAGAGLKVGADWGMGGLDFTEVPACLG